MLSPEEPPTVILVASLWALNLLLSCLSENVFVLAPFSRGVFTGLEFWVDFFHLFKALSLACVISVEISFPEGGVSSL